MEVVNLPLAGLKLIRPDVFRDGRGYFLETFRDSRYRDAGIDCAFVQDNHSRSAQGTVRGLHYQTTPGQAKLVRAASGCIYDVVVDIRPASPTFGRWYGAHLDAREHAQLFVPLGFAHGFCVLSETADVVYKVSTPYDPKTDVSIRWNDADIGIQWPVNEPLLSDRDKAGEPFAAFTARVRAK